MYSLRNHYIVMLLKTRALKCKPSAQIMRDDREVYCNYQVVDVYISGIVISLSIN